MQPEADYNRVLTDQGKQNENDDEQERCMGGDADGYGRQGVPLGVPEMYAGPREGHCERLCGKLPVRLRLDNQGRRHGDTRDVKAVKAVKAGRLKDNKPRMVARKDGQGAAGLRGRKVGISVKRKRRTAVGVRLPAPHQG